MYEDFLTNWTKNRGEIGELDEQTCKELISEEIKNRARMTVVKALHQRQSKLRTQREREALEARVEKVNARKKR